MKPSLLTKILRTEKERAQGVVVAGFKNHQRARVTYEMLGNNRR